MAASVLAPWVGTRGLSPGGNQDAVEALADGVVGAGEGMRALVEVRGILITCLPNPEAVGAVYAEVDKPGLLALPPLGD